MTRIGFATGYDPGLTVRDMIPWVKAADVRGYEIAFFSETIALMRDSVTALSAFALSSERMTLGSTQVVRLRSPVVMAQTLATLDELSGGRIILAPGACTPTHARRHSLEPLDPVLTLTEWLGAIRAILADGEASFEGRVVRLEDVGLGWSPARRRIPFWVAATSRTGLRMAARVGDGVLLNSACSPEYTRNAVGILRQAVEEAGRDWSQFEVAQLINCSLEEDRRAAYEAIRWEIASKLDPIQAPFNAGPRMRVGEPYIREEDLPLFEEAYRRGGKPALMAALPEAYIQGLTASGTAADVLERVERYRGAGVRLPILRPAALHQTGAILDLFAPD